MRELLRVGAIAAASASGTELRLWLGMRTAALPGLVVRLAAGLPRLGLAVLVDAAADEPCDDDNLRRLAAGEYSCSSVLDVAALDPRDVITSAALPSPEEALMPNRNKTCLKAVNRALMNNTMHAYYVYT